MKTIPRIIVFLALSASLVPPASAESLGEVLRQSGWDKIVGNWGDAETKGEKLKVSYAWKFKDRVLTVDTRAGDNRSTALIAMKDGEVVHAAADNQGGVGLGVWHETDDGDVVLKIEYAGSDGVKSEMNIRQNLVDGNSIKVTVSSSTSDQVSTFTLVRLK